MSGGAFRVKLETQCAYVCLFRLDFDYLNELPVLVLDVDGDFRSDWIKQEAIINKVPFSFFLLFHL